MYFAKMQRNEPDLRRFLAQPGVCNEATMQSSVSAPCPAIGRFAMLTTAVLERILASIPALKIGVLGDLFLDRYLDLDASLTEPSIETGLDAYQVVSVRSYPGAAGTVINNLAALGVGHIIPISMLGDDGEGYELRQVLQKMPSVDMANLVVCTERRTPTYTKPMLGKSGEVPRELNRLAIKNRQPLPRNVEHTMMELLS